MTRPCLEVVSTCPELINGLLSDLRPGIIYGVLFVLPVEDTVKEDADHSPLPSRHFLHLVFVRPIWDSALESIKVCGSLGHKGMDISDAFSVFDGQCKWRIIL